MWQFLIFVVIIALLACLRQINQYERGVIFTMGKYSGTYNPGWRLIIPIFQFMRKVDLRVKALDVPSQDAITRDNVSAKINAVIYYKIDDPSKTVLEVENVHYAVLQLAQTSMRNVVGEVSLDELLVSRMMVSEKIEKLIEATTESWGVQVSSVELKDINLAPEMIRTMAKKAEAERERDAVVINSEGEVRAAENIAKAAEILGSAPGALHLRTLNSINDISSDQSNTIVFTVPLEILQAISGYKK